MQNKLPLPIGASDYKKVSQDYYYVDKTLLIKDILDEQAKVTLFTRPRRFGKTLNMDMLRTFFEKPNTIQANILSIKVFGRQVKNIHSTKDNILLFS